MKKLFIYGIFAVSMPLLGMRSLPKFGNNSSSIPQSAYLKNGIEVIAVKSSYFEGLWKKFQEADSRDTVNNDFSRMNSRELGKMCLGASIR